MKMLASAVALIMVGLTGMWLWFDATADARQDLPGVVVTAEAAAGGDPEVRQPGDEPAPSQEQEAAAKDADASAEAEAAQARESADRENVTSRMVNVDTLLATLRASRGDLTALADDIVTQVKDDRAKADSGGEGSSGSTGVSGWTGNPAPQPPPPPPPAPAPQPQPVNPAPVTPPGMCWDDGELEECDDDDWDDDDWDDDDGEWEWDDDDGWEWDD